MDQILLAGHPLTDWLIFHLLIFFLLALDLGFFNRKAHVIKPATAVLWSIFWITLGLGFGVYLLRTQGPNAGYEYLTGYVVEKSLSVDNLFVFLLIFSAMKIEPKHQHRLLFWGIIGALILRGLMIASGSVILEKFHWVIFVFGGFLVLTGIKLLGAKGEPMDPLKSPVLKFAKKILPLDLNASSAHFVVRNTHTKKYSFTPAFLTLLLIESSDVIFAIDSVPAVFGVTRDPYIVYTSNIFAILGLRSLYFVLENLLERFHLLKNSLAIILTLVGCKMLAEHWFKVSSGLSLVVILGILAGGILASFLKPKPKK